MDLAIRVARALNTVRDRRPLGYATPDARRADIPVRYGPYTTCGNRFRRWRKRGVWDRVPAAMSKAYEGGLQMVDATGVRMHQHAARAEKDGGSGGTGRLILSLSKDTRRVDEQDPRAG